MSYKRVFLKVGRLLGVQQSSGGHLEKIVSGVGGVVGIVAVILVSQDFLGTNGSPLIIASLGASAVLLFAVPHGPLSQPWAVLGGHTLSAVIGVTCAELPGDKYIAAALAVGLSIAVMHYCRCIHPPGGATALTAVIGGDAIQGLGYQYVVTPVLTSACVILAVAVLVNLPFSARRYPIALGQWLGEREANKRKR
jgi:CBS-domain-containing membrane protein